MVSSYLERVENVNEHSRHRLCLGHIGNASQPWHLVRMGITSVSVSLGAVTTTRMIVATVERRLLLESALGRR
jgi:hypothetical protein